VAVLTTRRRLFVLFRSALLILSTLPLLVFAATAAIRSHFSWRVIVLTLFAFTVTGAVAIIANWGDIRRSMSDAHAFWRAFRHCTFTPVSVDAYSDSLRRFCSREIGDSRTQLEEKVVPLWRFDRKRLRISVVSLPPDEDGPVPGYAVTYASLLGAWVLLHVPLKELTPLQYFVLLHEVGHTSVVSFTDRGVEGTVRLAAVCAAPFLLASIAPTPMQTVLLAGLAVGWCVAAVLEARRLEARAQLSDETFADKFAIERCPRDWYEQYSEEKIAITLFGGPLSNEPDAFQHSQAVQARTQLFIDNLRRRRSGEELKSLPSIRKLYVASWLEAILALAIAVCCGFAAAPLNWARLLALTGLTVLALAAMCFVLGVFLLHAAILDDLFNVEKVNPNLAKILERGEDLRRNLQTWKIFSGM
jgi:hypothetical protein